MLKRWSVIKSTFSNPQPVTQIYRRERFNDRSLPRSALFAEFAIQFSGTLCALTVKLWTIFRKMFTVLKQKSQPFGNNFVQGDFVVTNRQVAYVNIRLLPSFSWASILIGSSVTRAHLLKFQLSFQVNGVTVARGVDGWCLKLKMPIMWALAYDWTKDSLSRGF